MKALATLYEQFSLKENEIDESIAAHFSKVFNSRLQKVLTVSNRVSGTIFLYFDLDPSTFDDSDSLRKMWTSMSELRVQSELVSVLNELETTEKDEGQKRIIQINLDNVMENARAHIRQLSEVYDKSHKEMIELIKKLRKELARYDM